MRRFGPIKIDSQRDLAPDGQLEIYFAYTRAEARLGATLGACFTDMIKNRQLRVESVVAVLASEPMATNMAHLSEVRQIAGLFEAPNPPDHLGTPFRYAGSITGPSCNEEASPFQMT